MLFSSRFILKFGFIPTLLFLVVAVSCGDKKKSESKQEQKKPVITSHRIENGQAIFTFEGSGTTRCRFESDSGNTEWQECAPGEEYRFNLPPGQTGTFVVQAGDDLISRDIAHDPSIAGAGTEIISSSGATEEKTLPTAMFGGAENEVAVANLNVRIPNGQFKDVPAMYVARYSSAKGLSFNSQTVYEVDPQWNPFSTSSICANTHNWSISKTPNLEIKSYEEGPSFVYCKSAIPQLGPLAQSGQYDAYIELRSYIKNSGLNYNFVELISEPNQPSNQPAFRYVKVTAFDDHNDLANASSPKWPQGNQIPSSLFDRHCNGNNSLQQGRIVRAPIGAINSFLPGYQPITVIADFCSSSATSELGTRVGTVHVGRFLYGVVGLSGTNNPYENPRNHTDRSNTLIAVEFLTSPLPNVELAYSAASMSAMLQFMLTEAVPSTGGNPIVPNNGQFYAPN